MKSTNRIMTVSYGPGDKRQKPMIRIINRFLINSGFLIGSKFMVKYENNRIVIIRLPIQN